MCKTIYFTTSVSTSALFSDQNAATVSNVVATLGLVNNVTVGEKSSNITQF